MLISPHFSQWVATRHTTRLCAFYTKHRASESSATRTERVRPHPFQQPRPGRHREGSRRQQKKASQGPHLLLYHPLLLRRTPSSATGLLGLQGHRALPCCKSIHEAWVIPSRVPSRPLWSLLPGWKVSCSARGLRGVPKGLLVLNARELAAPSHPGMSPPVGSCARSGRQVQNLDTQRSTQNAK